MTVPWVVGFLDQCHLDVVIHLDCGLSCGKQIRTQPVVAQRIHQAPDLRDDSHKGVCAYCASWTPRRREARQYFEHTTIDHYIAKSRDKNKAYDWDNFRLCRSRLNNRKADFDDVLDPCQVLNEWFWLEFTTFLIRPAHGLPEQTREQVKATIDRLELNSDVDYVYERVEVVRGYCTGVIPFQVVETRYPFIAYQMLSQDFDSTLKGRFSQHFSGN